LSHYEKELEEMKHMSRQEFIAHLRRYGRMMQFLA
jgi:AP2-like factor (ANT lineage)